MSMQRNKKVGPQPEKRKKEIVCKEAQKLDPFKKSFKSTSLNMLKDLKENHR